MFGRDTHRLRHGRGDGVDIPRAALTGEGVGIAGIDEDGEAVPGRFRQLRQLVLTVEHGGRSRVAERVNTPASVLPGAISASIRSVRPA